ncbi:hypothetical protein CHUAL_004258 [Chamberlinius hualienensis]
MEKIPGQVGFLVLTEDGSVLNSGGELENAEKTAEIISNLINGANKRNLSSNSTSTKFHRISITVFNA